MRENFLTNDEYKQLKDVIKTNKNKTVHKRLRVIELWQEGYTQEEIAKMTGYTSRQTVHIAIKRFKEQGLEEFARLKYGANRRNLTIERETEILETFRKKLKQGEFVTVKSIKLAFDNELGRDTKNYVYKVLQRHNWRSVVPRPTHPNGASKEEIEASKKLTPM